MDFSVRPARADDIPPMCDLLAELFSVESDFSPDRQKQTQGLNLLLGDTAGSSAVFVAECAGEIMGMCSVQTLISTVEGGPAGLLEDVIVGKQHRGKGIGKRLLSEVVAWCARKNISRLQLLRDADNVDALKFYHTNGWCNTKLLCMRKFV
jgi:GNAT superfamily N-acetyltransferase